MTLVLVVLGESTCSAGLGDAVRRHAGADAANGHFVAVAPRFGPRYGWVVYDDERRDAALGRLQLALASLTDAGLSASGIVTGPDPRSSVLDIVDELPVGEIVVALAARAPATRRQERVLAALLEATELPVSALSFDPRAAGSGPRIHTLVVAAETVGAETLREAVVARHRAGPRHFILLVPHAPRADGVLAQRLLTAVVGELRSDGVSVDGVLGHPDPYTAIRNVLVTDGPDEVLIATPSSTRSGWLRRDLVRRVRRRTTLPVQRPEAAAASRAPSAA